MTRPTLENLIKDRLAMQPYEFAMAVGLNVKTLRRYYNKNRLLLNLIIAGYEREVLIRRP
jgi:hypothetical protein